MAIYTRLFSLLPSSSPISWPTKTKTLIVVGLYLLLNLKSLPFAWHLRVFYHLLGNFYRRPTPPPPLLGRSKARNPATRRILTHPLFHPVSLTTHTPLLEADYNLHKSNSTYFTDMDVSRSKLFSRLFSPAFRRLNVELEEEGHNRKGRLVVALGGVHMSFRRELGIYERVEVRSRVVGWDEKWIIILSCFVRRKKGQKGGQEEELCAVGLSKYVIKKGRFTVAPERVFSTGGWLPSKRGGDEYSGSVQNGAIETAKAFDAPHDEPEAFPPGRGNGNDEIRPPDGIDDANADAGLKVAQIPQAAETVVLDIEKTAAMATENTPRSTEETVWDAEAWSWEEIEEERQKGLQLAKGWLALDAELYTEFEGH